MKLTPEQQKILKYLATAKDPVSQQDISSLFKIAQSNVSGYYFKPLKENGVIEEKEKKGRTPYFGLTQNYVPLKWLFEAQEKHQKMIQTQVEQMELNF